MAYDLAVFIKHADVMKVDGVERAVVARDLVVSYEGALDLVGLRGFLPCILNGVETGFEVLVDEGAAEEALDYREDVEASGDSVEGDSYYALLVESDYVFTLTCKGDLELEAAAIFAEGMRSIGASSFDPQTNQLIGPDGKELEVK